MVGTGDFTATAFLISYFKAAGNLGRRKEPRIGGGSVGNPGPRWHVVGVGDYNRDHKTDILLQNDSGEIAIWEMNGTTVIGGGSLGNPGPSWHV
jgi:hypothetical protein